MKHCQACGNVQNAGNFCAKCGGTLTEVAATNNDRNSVPTEPTGQPIQSTPNYQQPSQPPFQQEQQFQQQGQQYQQHYQQASPAQPNVHVERMKDQSKQFINYFTTYIKQPSSIFGSGERQFTNGLIAIIAYALIIGLTLFTFVYKLSGGWYDTGTIFFNVFLGSTVFILAIFAIIVISLIIVAKGFGPDTTWKELVSFLGTLSIPSIVLSILSLLLFIISVYDLGNWFFVASLLLVISAVPLYIIARLLTIKTKSLDSFYAYLVYIVIFSILFYVLSNVFWNNTVGKFMDSGFW